MTYYLYALPGKAIRISPNSRSIIYQYPGDVPGGAYAVAEFFGLAVTLFFLVNMVSGIQYFVLLMKTQDEKQAENFPWGPIALSLAAMLLSFWPMATGG